jgi:hypothetical protein
MMEYANGDLDYDNATNTSIDRGWFSDEDKYKGLMAADSERLAEAVFGTNYQSYTSVAAHDMSFPPNSWAKFEGWFSTATGKEYSGHAITPVKVEDGRLYFRDPNGSLASTPISPAYRFEEAWGPNGTLVRGYYSMSLADFLAHRGSVLVPE